MRTAFGAVAFVLGIAILMAGCANEATDPTLQKVKKLNPHERDSLLKKLLAGYKDTFNVDTTEILANGDTETLRIRHYCVYDNKISVPREYLDVYGLTAFQTHNFVSDVEFKINSRIIFKGTISKAIFNKSISDRLAKSGTLSVPYANMNSNGFTIEYGIGVPLTDYYDNGLIIKVDSTGKIKDTGTLD
jgi:hypothetical protein